MSVTEAAAPVAPEVAPTAATAAPSFEDLARAVDDAIARVEALEGDARETARVLQQAIEAFHRPALVHIVRALRGDPRGKELLFQMVDDPNVHAVLALHGIVRADPATRAERALATVRPYLQSHGGDVELVKVDGATAFVRLHGSCSGCSMSAVTLRESVEEALVRMVDEIDGIEVLDDQPTTAFIPLSSVGRKPDSGWVKAVPVGEVAPATMVRFDVEVAPATPDDPAHVDGFLVTNIDGRISVFRNECVHQGLSLDGGLLDDGVLTCPWHGFRFDASTGECISSPNAQLVQVPTRIDDGHVWIRARGS